MIEDLLLADKRKQEEVLKTIHENPDELLEAAAITYEALFEIKKA